MNVSQINKLIVHYAEEFLNIAQAQDNLKYNETISVFWVIFRIMNHFTNPKVREEINTPTFKDLCVLLSKSIIGDNYNNDLKNLIKKLDNQTNLPETIFAFLSNVDEDNTIHTIEPKDIVIILKDCVDSGGSRKRKISRRSTY